MATFNSRPDLDEELAAMTDSLMSGQDQSVSPENAQLANVVRKLYSTIGPSASSGADATFRAHLTQRLNDEWESAGRQHQSQRFMQPRTLRALSVAAAMTLVLFFVLIIL